MKATLQSSGRKGNSTSTKKGKKNAFHPLYLAKIV
jgi:hypothetical protein